MRIKKYIAPSMPEAMKKIRAELGSDAVILNSKVIHTGGFLGLFKKRKIEVVAAIDPDLNIHQQTIGNKNSQQEKKFKLQNDQLNDLPEQEDYHKNKNDFHQIKSAEEQSLMAEISTLKKLINDMESKSNIKSTIYPEQLQEIASLFTYHDIDNAIKQEVMDELTEKWFASPEKPSSNEVLLWTKQILIDRISHNEFGELSYDKKYINVIGPTGVGKTTTLAKMAATAVLKHKKRAAFITTDTYRIAAIDQLKTYAKILCIPLEVCYTADDFQQAIEKFRNYEAVFIDTAGRNFRNKQYVDDLQKFLKFNNEMETYLVLALTAKQSDMDEIYKQFSTIDIDKLIFTKVDETDSYGAILNMIDKYDIGVAYLTNGQDVPDDILAVNPTVIMNTIFGE